MVDSSMLQKFKVFSQFNSGFVVGSSSVVAWFPSHHDDGVHTHTYICDKKIESVLRMSEIPLDVRLSEAVDR